MTYENWKYSIFFSKIMYISMYYYLIILDIVHWLFGFGSVGLHNIIMHQCLGPKKAKTTWATHYRAKNMLSSFLKDMPNPIFKFLVTIQESWAHLLGINKYIIRNLEKNNIEKKLTGCILPHAAPIPLSFFIKSTRSFTALGWKSMSPSRVKM